MAQHTAFGAASLVTYIRVDKADGSILYYKVVDEENVQITEQEYKENN